MKASILDRITIILTLLGVVLIFLCMVPDLWQSKLLQLTLGVVATFAATAYVIEAVLQPADAEAESFPIGDRSLSLRFSDFTLGGALFWLTVALMSFAKAAGFPHL